MAVQIYGWERHLVDVAQQIAFGRLGQRAQSARSVGILREDEALVVKALSVRFGQIDGARVNRKSHWVVLPTTDTKFRPSRHGLQANH